MTADMWDRRFTEQPWPTEPDQLLVELAAALPPGRAADLASGPGRNGLWLAARGWDVTAVDASRVALTQAAQRASTLGLSLETIQADLADWRPHARTYDLVVVANLHPGGEVLRGVLAGAADALVAGGHLFVVGHDLANLGRHGPPDADRLLSVERLSAALPATVTVETLERRVRPLDPADGAEQGSDAEDVAVLAWATKNAA